MNRISFLSKLTPVAQFAYKYRYPLAGTMAAVVGGALSYRRYKDRHVSMGVRTVVSLGESRATAENLQREFTRRLATTNARAVEVKGQSDDLPDGTDAAEVLRWAQLTSLEACVEALKVLAAEGADTDGFCGAAFSISSSHTKIAQALVPFTQLAVAKERLAGVGSKDVKEQVQQAEDLPAVYRVLVEYDQGRFEAWKRGANTLEGLPRAFADKIEGLRDEAAKRERLRPVREARVQYAQERGAFSRLDGILRRLGELGTITSDDRKHVEENMAKLPGAVAEAVGKALETTDEPDMGYSSMQVNVVDDDLNLPEAKTQVREWLQKKLELCRDYKLTKTPACRKLQELLGDIDTCGAQALSALVDDALSKMDELTYDVFKGRLQEKYHQALVRPLVKALLDQKRRQEKAVRARETASSSSAAAMTDSSGTLDVAEAGRMLEQARRRMSDELEQLGGEKKALAESALRCEELARSVGVELSEFTVPEGMKASSVKVRSWWSVGAPLVVNAVVCGLAALVDYRGDVILSHLNHSWARLWVRA